MKKTLLGALLVFAFAGTSLATTLRVNVMPSGASSQPHVWDARGPYSPVPAVGPRRPSRSCGHC